MKQFLLLLIVAGFCTSSLTYADEVYPASILQNPWNCIMTKWLIDSRGSISLDTFKGYLLNPQSACQRDQSMLPTPPIAGLFDNYPKCDTTDITLGNGQVWSACNVGATQAYTGTSYNGLFSPMPTKMQIGHYFQWGKMTGWISQAGKNPSIGYSYPSLEFTKEMYNPIYDSGSLWDKTTLNQGPCQPGYHVPSENEWLKAFEYIGLGKQNEFNNRLKLSAEFNLGTYIETLYHEGGYWSTTTNGESGSSITGMGEFANGYMVNSDARMYTNTYSNFAGTKSLTALIRCIKD